MSQEKKSLTLRLTKDQVTQIKSTFGVDVEEIQIAPLAGLGARLQIDGGLDLDQVTGGVVTAETMWHNR